MGTAAALLDWARSQLGVTENPPGSNHVRYWDDCNMRGFQGEPWCAAFVLAGLLATNTQPTSRSVFVPQLVNDYRKARSLLAPKDAQPGDQALFNIGKGHTGIIEYVDPKLRAVTCIEGNTSSDKRGSQDNGGGVFRRTRPWSDLWGVGRPVFSAPVTHPPITYKDDMKLYPVEVGGLDSNGHGYTDLDGNEGRPLVPAGTVVSVRVNSADYQPIPESPGDQDFGGHARIQWVGPANARAFSARVWVAQ
jgi:hypothetical protein